MAFTHPNFDVIRELGRGGNATVYLAVQRSLNRRVAVKLMHGGGWLDDQQKARFLREGRIVAKLNHPNIVPVYEVGEADDAAKSLFLVMEYLSGGTLSENADKMTIAELRRTISQVCSALAYSHEHDIVHRDVKPDNVLFKSPEHAMLGDFGIARTADSLTQMTVTGTLLGTPDYMSPEQVSGSAVDGRSDLYSLGVMLYELLTGYRPIEGESMMATGLQHLTVDPRPLPENISALQPCMDRLLAKQPDERFDGANQVAEAFNDALTSMRVDETTQLNTLHAGIKPERVALDTLLTAARPVTRPQRGRWALGAAAVTLIGAVFVAFDQDFFGADEPEPEIQTASSPPITPPGPSPTDQALRRADEAFRLDRWFGNDETDAVPVYRQVLELDPGNELAAQRLQAMLETSVARAQQMIEQGSLDAAALRIDQIAEAWPANAEVSSLRESLVEARQTRESQVAANRRAAEVRALLADASAAQSTGTWITQDEQGALQLYAKVLSLDSDNAVAGAGMDQVVLSIRRDIEQDVDALAFDEAEQKHNNLRSVLDELSIATNQLDGLSDHIANARTAEEARQAQARIASVLKDDIDRYLGQAAGWLRDADSQLDARYEALTSDLSALLDRAPENERLLAMRLQLEGRAQQIQEAETQNREEPVRPPVTF